MHMILPGWDDLESARAIHASFEFAGLLFFAALVLFEILTIEKSGRQNGKLTGAGTYDHVWSF